MAMLDRGILRSSARTNLSWKGRYCQYFGGTISEQLWPQQIMQSSPSEMAQTSISTTFPTKTSNHKTIGIVTRPILRRHSHHLCLFSMECSGTTRNTQPTPFSFHSSKTTLTTYILLSLFSPRVDWLKCVMVMLHVLFYLRHRLTN